MKKIVLTGATLAGLFAIGSMFQSSVSPVHAATYSSPVSVVNANNAPAFVSFDTFGRAPWIGTGIACVPNCTITFPAIASGFRLVIEDISTNSNYLGSAPATLPAVELIGPSNGYAVYLTPATTVDSNGNFRVVTQAKIQYVVDGGGANGPIVAIAANHASPTTNVSLSGHLLNCSIAACPPIVTATGQ